MSSQDLYITLPLFSAQEASIFKRYLNESHLFSGSEWYLFRHTIAKLAQGIVSFDTQEYQFAQFYRTFINGTYAYPFLEKLKQIADLERDGTRAQAQVAKQISQWLQLNGIQVGQVQHAEYLVTYCLAQWGAFARGYLFEVRIIRDLQQHNIRFNAHDLIQERFAPYDLHVDGIGYGDVKTSRYFLDEFVADRSIADFYVTRVYLPVRKEYLIVVFLTPWAWNRL